MWAIHFVSAWQQSNSLRYRSVDYVKKNKEGSDVTEIDTSVVDYVTDWAHCWCVCVYAYVPVEQSSRCGVLCVGEMLGKVGSGTCTKERQSGCRDSSCTQTNAQYYRNTVCSDSREQFFVSSHHRKRQANITNIEKMKIDFLKKSNANLT
jgi:hypothetical protein